jgi:hypothetical protein
LLAMDPISAAASIIALVETIAIISKSIAALCRELYDAPDELDFLTMRLLVLEAELSALLHLNDIDLSKVILVP